MQPTIDIMARQGSGATRLSEVVYSDSSVHHKELMGDEYVELKFSVAERVRILAGDFVAIPGTGTFYANEEARPQRNRNTGGWDYEVRFFAHWKRWGNHKLMYDRQAGGELSWSLTSTAFNFLSIVKSNLRALGYVGEDFSTAVSPAADEAGELAKMKYIKFEDADILSALKQIAEAWDTEYLITEHGITLGRVEYGSEVLLQENDNINPISTRRGSKERATRLYAFGSDRNLTKNYRKNESSPEAIEAVVERRLKLPAGTPYVDYPDNLDPNDVVEAVCVFNDIYPRFISTITEVQPLDRVKEEEVVKEDGKFETVEKHWTVYRFRCDITGFKRDYILEREELKITFNPGSNANPQHVCRLGGMEFAVAWNPEGVYDEDSYEAQWWEIVANEDYGIELPAPGFAPQIGDQFVLTGFNIEALSDPGDPLGYVRSAEQELLAEARKKAAKLAIDDTVYTCPTNPVRCAGYVPQPGGTFSHDVSREVDLDIGQAVKLRRAGEEDRSSRVRAFDKKLANRYDCEYQVGESAAYSRTGELAGKLQEMKMGGFGFSLGSGSGSSVYLIKRHDSTAASDFNVFSALRSRSEFLSKSSSDTAQEPIKFDKHLTTGEYSQGTAGGYFGQTAHGSLSEVDFLKVRKKAQFETLEIQHVKGAGGKIVLSAGDGCEITGVQAVNGGWRCFYKGREEGEDGSVQRIVPFFQPGDQIISRTSNAATSSGAIALENRYWWRLCTAVGEGWFELSASDCDHGSDAPRAGDSCAHLGNHGSQALGIAEDKTRQGAVTLSTTEPSSEAVVTVLSGIDSYSLEGRDAVTMGVDSDGLPCLYVYGRAYVGPRDQSTYVKYEPGQGVQIKGSLSVDSTVGGDTLEGYVGGIAEEATAQAEADAAEALAKAEQASQDALSARDRLDLWMQDGKITKIEARSLADELQRVREDWEYFVAEYAQFGAGMPAGAQTKKEAYENMLATLSTFGQNEEAKDIPAGFQDAMEAWYDVRTTMLEELANFARAYADSKAQDVDGKYAYLKAALEGSTTINGGLVLTSVISVSDGDGRSNAGLSGIVMDGSSAERPSRPGGGIAFWAGGDMEDLLSYYRWDDGQRQWVRNSEPMPADLRIAQAVDRMDGTGYRAGGNLWWDETGNVHANPMSFFVGEETVGNLLQLFRINYPQNGNTFDHIINVTPRKPFELLWFGKDIDNKKLLVDYDEINNAIHFHGSLYADGFISAFGLNAASSGGLDVEQMWAELGASGTSQIHASHLTAALTPYATTADVQGMLTGYTDTAGVNSLLAGYLPLAGGALAGALTINLPSNVTNNYNDGIRCNLGGTGNWATLMLGGAPNSTSGTGQGVWGLFVHDKTFSIGHASSSNAAYGLNWNHTGELNFKTSALTNNGNPILGSDNFSTYVTQSYINGLSIDAATLGGTALGSLLSSVSLGTDGAVSVTVGGSTKTSSAASGTWGISVTGNAATATKLATSRSLWGNAFDGTADVAGAIKFASVEYINGTASLLTVGNATSGKSLTLTSGGTTTLSGVTTTISAGNNASISAVGDLSLSSTNSKILANSDVKIASGKRLYFKDDAHYIELTDDGFHFSHGVYSDSFVTAFGVGTSSGGGGGLDTVQMWQELAANNNNNQIHASHLSNAMSGYVQSSELTGYVNTSTAQDVGGVKTFTQQPTVKLSSAPRICYKAGDTFYGYIGCNAANVPTFWASAGTDPKTLLHEGNFGSYVTKSYVDGLGINATQLGGLTSDKVFRKYNRADVGASLNLDTTTLFGIIELRTTEITTTNAPREGFGAFLNFGNGEHACIQIAGVTGDLYYRSGQRSNGGNGADKSAWAWAKFLDSSNYTNYAPTKTGSGASGTWGISITGSAASATYATTAGSAGHADTATNFDHMVSIWGQSFTGNSGISGDMTGVGSITMSDDLIMGGDLYMANTKSLRFADSGGTYREAMGYTNSNLLRIGYGQFASASSAYDTQINGKVLHLRSGANTESIKDTTIDENGWLNPYANIRMKNNAAIYSKTSDGTSNAQMLKLSNGDLMMIGNTEFETNYYGGAEISFGGHHGKYGIRILTEQSGESWISKVGIDKWTPECSLHVGGNTKIDGTLTVTGQGWFKEHVNIELNKGFKWSNALLIQGFMGSGGPSLTMGVSTTAGIVTLQGIGISINAPLNGVSVSGNLSATGGITAMAVTSSSDIRLKENIRPLELSASQVAMLPAVEYDWRDGSGRDCGTIAQQMAAVFPLCVKANSDGMLTVDYGKAGLLSAIAVAKEHGNRIAELEARVSALEEENSYLRAQIAN